MGIHIGLEMITNGAKKRRVRIPIVIVIPVKKSKNVPDMRRVRNPISCVDVGAFQY
ncbi:unnamed protein product [Linum tenue]|uniref:Uncharacterized protein n=1 Tax=Linum tenue TaxID=586396 RepID=A0AAV0QU28_9ROSI|nr:unnamed protein product [Linum tenue]